MIITKKWLQKQNACAAAIERFLSQKETNGLKIVKKLVAENKLDWSNWLIVRIMNYKQRVSYAVYAAELVIEIYEKQYPTDNRPRLAIEAAKKCIKSPTEKNKKVARSAEAAVRSAETAAWRVTAARSAEAAAWSAEAAVRSVETALSVEAVRSVKIAAWSAEAAVRSAEAAAWRVTAVARSGMKLKILNYGIKLLEVKK